MSCHIISYIISYHTDVSISIYLYLYLCIYVISHVSIYRFVFLSSSLQKAYSTLSYLNLIPLNLYNPIYFNHTKPILIESNLILSNLILPFLSYLIFSYFILLSNLIVSYCIFAKLF